MDKKTAEIKMRGQKTAELLLYNEIGGYGITGSEVVNALGSVKGQIDTLNVRIHSPGGSVFEGVAIYNALKRFDARVEVDIDGVALSIASYIALAGDVVRAAENTQYMIHNPWVMAGGESKDLRKLADQLDAIKQDLVRGYVKKTGLDAGNVAKLMDDETWFSAAEAQEFGFVDEVHEAQQLAAKFDDGLLARFKNQAKVDTLRADAQPKDESKVVQIERPRLAALKERATALNNRIRAKHGKS